MLHSARASDRAPPRIQRKDILGGFAVGLLIIVATMPIVVPFLIFSNQRIAIWVSNATALALLFWVGNWWGRTVGANPLRIGAGVTSVGLTLVLITIAFGG